MKLVTRLVNLLLAGKDRHVLAILVADETTHIVDLAKVETADLVQVICDEVHLCDELRDELDQRVQLVANFPATLTHDFIEKVSSVTDLNHLVGELSVTMDLGLTEGVLVRHHNLELILLNVLLD